MRPEHLEKIGPVRSAPAGAVAMLVLAATCYGLNAPFARLSSFAGVAATDIVALRVTVLLLVFLPLALLARIPLRVEPGERLALIGLGLTSGFTGIAYLSAIMFIPVGIAVLILYTYPLLILIASPFVDGSRLTAARLIAFALAFTGIALAVAPAAQALDWRGLALAAVAALISASQFFFAARAPGGGGAATLFWLHVVVLPIALATAFLSGGPAQSAALAAAAGPVAVTSLLYVLGIALQLAGIRSVSAAAAGLIFCLEPVVATLTAALVLGEHLSLPQYGGGALVLAGIVCSLAVQPGRPLRVKARP